MAFGSLLAIVSDQVRHADRGPVNVSSALRLPGADAEDTWQGFCSTTKQTVQLSHSSIWTTPEDGRASSPSSGDTETCHVVADARLDNRQELIREVGMAGSPAPSDGELILAAYARWGVECPTRLLGDFAFVLWDARTGTLLAARDMFGVRGLLYSQTPERFVVASTPNGAIAGLGVRPGPNREFLRDFLAGTPQTFPVNTAFENLSWLPPAHRLVLHRGRLDVTRYGSLVPRELDTRSDGLICEEFRSLLENAVTTRLRAPRRVGFFVSGGFDSSSVLCLANRAVSTGVGLELLSYSAVFEKETRADEREYLNPVLDACSHVKPTQVVWDERPWSLDALGPADGFAFEEPPETSRFFAVVLGRLAVADGCRVMLRGDWADQLLFRQPYAFVELLWDVPRHAFVRECHHFLKHASRSAIRGMSRGTVRAARRVAAGMGLGSRPDSAVASLLKGRFTWGQHAATMNYLDRLARFVGAESRYPFLDKRLHEFVMGLPPHFLFRNGQRKWVLRHALADLLPAVFRSRTTFGGIPHLFAEGALLDAGRIRQMLREPLVLQKGLVSIALLRKRLARLRPGITATEVVELQRVLAVEFWLRHEAVLAGKLVGGCA